MARYLMTHSLLSSWLYAMKENPYEDASTERDPYGSIPGRGTLRAVQQVQKWMRIVQSKQEQWYIGKMDVAKFFFRIPLDIQLRELGRPLDDPDMMWFLETAIRCDDRPFGLIPVEEDDDDMSYEKFKEYMTQYRKELQDNDKGEWSEEARAWAIKVGLFAGNGTDINGEPNYMWQDFLTREQAAQLFYRFARDHGMV